MLPKIKLAGYKRYLQKNNNKFTHTKNGNKNVNKNKKVKTHLKLAQLNKGNSKFATHKNLIMDTVYKYTPDVLVYSGANSNRDDKNIIMYTVYKYTPDVLV